LARPITPDTWQQLRHDPGAVLLIARTACLQSGPACWPVPGLLDEPVILTNALAWLDHEGPAFVDWGSPTFSTIHTACLAYARRAHDLAAQTGVCDAQAAWVAGLLAGLGWLAACAFNGAAVAACLADAALAHYPAATQQRHWGIDHAALGRRLARRWRLPDWLTAVVGWLGAPPDVARARGADLPLFHLLRLAIIHTPEPGLFLGPPLAVHAEDDRLALGLTPQVLHTSAAEPCSPDAPFIIERWEDPRRVPLLRDLLAVAAENRRLRDGRLHRRLEDEADDLSRALEEMVRDEQRRIQVARLEALAEFAAGAGHEINNPLAVISGQAQYLLGHAADWFDPEVEPEATRALKAVIAQTRRIHGILRDLMLFARPGPASRGWFDLPTLLGEVAASLGEVAAERKVRIELSGLPQRLRVHADAGQVRLALACLLRNAIEAAPVDGWARFTLRDPPGSGAVEVAVEDNGPGPDLAHRSSLFDPFFSGRPAGRGRGLGLPIAWRLARLQGGDLRLEPRHPDTPTRFVFTLPHSPADSETAHPAATPIHPDTDAA
jgi:signal transduction histidine kinase